MVFGFWSWVVFGFDPASCFAFSKAKDQKPKAYSIDILSAAAVAHGAKIKESTVNELSK